MKHLLIILSLLFIYSCSKTPREEVIERYENGSKKIVMKFTGRGTNEKMVEKISYDLNGDTLFLENSLENLKIKTDFNQNNQKIKQTTFKEGKPSGIWKYYDTNKNELIGTINFNKRALSKSPKKELLGEWLLYESWRNEEEPVNFSDNEYKGIESKRIFLENTVLNQMRMDFQHLDTTLGAAFNKHQCKEIFGNNICSDSINFHNLLSAEINYVSSQKKQENLYIFKINPSSVNSYPTKISEEERKNIFEEWRIELIDNSTMILREYNASIDVMMNHIY